jgi:S1/P1 Nuclease
MKHSTATLSTFCMWALLAVAMLSMTPRVAHSWGNEGHRITSMVAEQMLTARARIGVNDLLNGGSLSDAAMFVDQFREALKREVPGSDKWHYDNIPVCAEFKPAEHCTDGNCASVQAMRQLKILADKTKPKEERLLALRFLVHIVGDIHQPLHAADDNDLGGNRKIVVLPTSTEPRNLHIVWDVDLVKVTLRGVSETDFVSQLIRTYREEFSGWLRGNPIVWTADSHQAARRLVYGRVPGFRCGETDGKKTGFINDAPWGDTAVQLDADYVKGATGIIPTMLARAGARIGGMLNAALDPEGAAAKQKGAAPTDAASGTNAGSKPTDAVPSTTAPTTAPTPPIPPTPPKTESLQEALQGSPALVTPKAPTPSPTPTPTPK